MMRKRGLMTVVAAILLVVMPTVAQAAVFYPTYSPFGYPITVHVNGKYVATDVQPISEKGRVLLPMRAASEAIGASVQWNSADKSVTVKKSGIVARFYLNNKRYYVNNVAKYSDVAPKSVSNRTMLPIRVFSEAFGAAVNWDGNLLDVKINTGAQQAPPPALPADLPMNVRQAVSKYYVQPTKPGVGNWYHISTSGRERVYEILCVSEMADGSRHAVKLWGKNLQSGGDLHFLNIYTHTIGTFNGGFFMHGRGVKDSIYESDMFIGHTYTLPQRHKFKYENNHLRRVEVYDDIYGSSKPNDLFVAF